MVVQRVKSLSSNAGFMAKRFIVEIKTRFKNGGLLGGVWYFIRTIRSYLMGAIYVQSYTLYQRIRRKPLIHVIGDSHSFSYQFKRPFILHWIGPATAHNLGKPDSKTQSGEKLFKLIKTLPKRDLVMLVFGEIDCRYHIYNQYQKQADKVTIDHLIEQTISNYGEVIKTIRKSGFITCICSVAPPSTKPNNQLAHPSCGSPQIRADIHRLFNQKLKEFCQVNDCLYIDVHSRTSDKDGFMLPRYAYSVHELVHGQIKHYTDGVHMNHRITPLVVKYIRDEYSIGL